MKFHIIFFPMYSRIKCFNELACKLKIMFSTECDIIFSGLKGIKMADLASLMYHFCTGLSYHFREL